MHIASRPITVLIALLLICVPVAQVLVANPQPVIMLIFLPSLFVLYRIWMRDNAARWFASFLVALIISLAAYSTWQTEVWRSEQTQATTNTVATIEARGGGMQTYQYALIGCYIVGLVLLHVPSSRRWFRGG